MEYQYIALDFENHDIRLFKLLPGNFDDPVRISLFHRSLPPLQQPVPDIDWDGLKKSLPSDWQAYETVEGRVLFAHNSRERTSWKHPNSNASYTRDVGTPAEAATGVDFEALSYTWKPSEPMELITVVLNDIDAPQASPKSSPAGSLGIGEVLSATGNVSLTTRMTSWPFTAEASEQSRMKESVAYLNVRPNLMSALRHLRHSMTPRVLWVDAICIDQNDFEETAIHVARMDRIYLQASGVIVWLGSASKDSTLALEKLVEIGTQFEVVHGATLITPQCTHPEWQSQMPCDWPTRNALHDLLQRPWFQRLWIWQEILLANAEARIQCGEAIVSWYHVRKGLVLLRESCMPDLRMMDGMLCHPLLHLPYYVKHTMRSQQGTCMLLNATARSGCSDVRDRIYGLLGVFSKEISDRVVPNYSKQAPEIFQEFFMAFLEVYDSLDLLQFCSLATRTIEGLPSWVPDLTGSIIKPSHGTFASGSSKAYAKVVELNVLAVEGIVADKVRAVCNIPVRSVPMTLQEYSSIMKAWHSFAKEHMSGISSKQFNEAFFTTVRFGWIAERRTWGDDADVYDTDLKYLLDNPGLTDDEVASSNLLQSFARDRADTELFVTEAGKLGLGPLETKRGDALGVLLGSSFAMVLRPTSNAAAAETFAVVGQAFVPGLLDAEAVLGPLYPPWHGHFDMDPVIAAFVPRFKNMETGETVAMDPRLEGVEDVEMYLSPNALKARGVDVKTLYLV